MTEETLLQSPSFTIASKKKRRKCGILFSSRKQLNRARMGKHKAHIHEADVADTTRILSFQSGEHEEVIDLQDICEQPSETSPHSENLSPRHNEEDDLNLHEISTVRPVFHLRTYVRRV